MKQTDVVIIGSGIAGITAAIYLKRANIDFVILEGNLVGGLLNELKVVENYPGFIKSSGSEILNSLVDQVEYNEISITNDMVQTILKEPNGFKVVGSNESYQTKVVIVATGLNKALKMIPGEEKYSGMGVSYCASCDGNFFKGLDVAVVGNNNTALEESLYLANLVNKLYIICPDLKLNGDENLLNRINSSSNIEVILSGKVNEIKGDDFGVTSIVVNDNEISVAGVFPYVGKKSSSLILNNLKPEMNGIYVKVNSENMSNIPGLYVAGDLVDKKVRQLVTAASDGANAATCAILYIRRK